MTYASKTDVSVDKSRAEIEAVLKRYGASRFGYETGPHEAVIQFIVGNRHVRFVLPLPSADDPEFALLPKTGKPRIDTKRLSLWEQACRSRWRALLLAIKAKLEAIEVGISDFDSEFLSFLVDPTSNRTVGETILPELEKRYLEVGKSRGPLRLTQGPTT